jgi:hypothetical protein
MVSGVFHARMWLIEISVPESMKTASQGTEPSNLDEEIPASRTFKFCMNVQLTLILFLVLCSLYDHVWCGRCFSSSQTLFDTLERIFGSP